MAGTRKNVIISSSDNLHKNIHILGFRDYMRSVYSYLFLGLLCLSLSIYLFTTAFMKFYTFYYKFHLVISFAPIFMLLFARSVLDSFSVFWANVYYFSLCFMIGLGFAPFAISFRDVLLPALLISSGMFLGMSVYGYCTSKDLTSLSGYVICGSIGLFISVLAEWYFPQLSFINNIFGVGLSLIFIAYDTHNIKKFYYYGGDTEKHAIFGALLLFVDFYNLLLFLLRILGSGKKRD